MREEEKQLREREEYALLPQRLSIGPGSGAPCSPWAKGGGLFCPPCLGEMESEHIPPLKDSLHSPFPPGKPGRVIPLLWPKSCRAHHCQANSVLQCTTCFMQCRHNTDPVNFFVIVISSQPGVNPATQNKETYNAPSTAIGRPRPMEPMEP